MTSRFEFSLNIETAEGREIVDNETGIIEELRVANASAAKAFDMDGVSYGYRTWENYLVEIQEFSLKHPEMLFLLVVQGKAEYDQTTYYVVNGRSHSEKLRIFTPDFDPNLLK